MIITRRTRSFVACLGIAMLLFAQLATAAHACAASAAAAGASLGAPHDAAPCDAPAPADPGRADANVCFAHCYADASSVDHPPALALVPLSAYPVPPLDRCPGAVAASRRNSPDLLARVTAPPLPVLNCCLRT